MRKKLTDIAILVCGIVASVFPAGLAVYLADQQGLNSEHALVRSYAQDALRRSETVADQIMVAFATFDRLEKAEGACGPHSIAEMRQFDLGSSYIQAVGKTAGSRILCSSMGLTNTRINFGAPAVVNAKGVRIFKDADLPFAPDEPLLVVERSGYFALIHKDLPIDTALGVKGVSLATFSTLNGNILTSRGQINPHWVERFVRTGETYFIADNQIVSIQGSTRHKIGSLAAAPLGTMLSRLGNTALILLAAGIAAGLLIAGIFIYLHRRMSALPSLMRQALAKDEFFLAYQPVVELKTGRWVGAEVLIRWQLPNGEMVRPDTFIPVAEEFGLIDRITERVIELAKRDAEGLFRRRPDFHLALNLSATNLYDEKTVHQLDVLAAATGAEAGNLIVEITERSFTDSERAAEVLNALRKRGIKVAIDDFGTGYSNIGLLQKLSLDYLKIDKSFIDSIGTEAATSGVIEHIVGMAKSLGLGMIAEGVETEEQTIALRNMEVCSAQGWYFAKAMPFDELMAQLDRQPANIPAIEPESAPVVRLRPKRQRLVQS